MNMNRLINMGLRMLVNRGINAAANRGKRPAKMNKQERQNAQSARKTTHNARRGIAILRRFMR